MHGARGDVLFLGTLLGSKMKKRSQTSRVFLAAPAGGSRSQHGAGLHSLLFHHHPQGTCIPSPSGSSHPVHPPARPFPPPSSPWTFPAAPVLGRGPSGNPAARREVSRRQRKISIRALSHVHLNLRATCNFCELNKNAQSKQIKQEKPEHLSYLE